MPLTNLIGSRNGAVVEHLPPTNVARVEFVVDSLPCSERYFSGYSGFPLSSKTNISKFHFDLEFQYLPDNHYSERGLLTKYYNLLFFYRLSWPPKPLPSKLIYGSRPLSPPVTFPPAKVPRAVPGGYVSKMPIPSYPDSSDSGYSDWQQSRWDNTMRSQHSSLGYAGDARYY